MASERGELGGRAAIELAAFMTTIVALVCVCAWLAMTGAFDSSTSLNQGAARCAAEMVKGGDHGE